MKIKDEMKLSLYFLFSELTAVKKSMHNDGNLIQKIMPPAINSILMTAEPHTTVGWQPKNNSRMDNLDEEYLKKLERDYTSKKSKLFFNHVSIYV